MKKALINCSIVKGTSTPRVQGGCVLVDGDCISEVGAQKSILPDPKSFEGTIIDLKGWTILPGLMDMHIHLSTVHPWSPTFKMKTKPIPYVTVYSAKRAIEQVREGVTFLRVMGEMDHIDIALKEVFESGMLLGPRLFVAGKGITATGGHGYLAGKYWEADGPEEFRKIARQELRAGADFIKILASGGINTRSRGVMSEQLVPEEIRAVTDVAHQADRHVAAHATGPASIIACVENGVDCIEHGFVLDDRAIEVMVKKGTIFCPTLTVTWAWDEDFLRANHYEEWLIKNAKEAAESHLAGFRKAVKAGIPVVAGTDELPAACYNGAISLVKEIEIMAENGLSNREAIQAATIHCARLCGVDDKLGTVEKGKWADLIAVEGDPLKEISKLRNLRFVMKNGEVVRHDKDGKGSSSSSREWS